MTDPSGIVTRWGYDPLGRVVTLTTHAGTAQQTITLNQYDNAGRVLRATRNYWAGQPQNYAANGSVYNTRTQYQYDMVGQVVLVTDTLGFATFTEYDPNNRPVTVTRNYAPGNSGADYNLRTVTGYDPAGNVVTTTTLYGTPLSRTTVTEYDALNRPIAVTQNYTGNGAFDARYPDWNITTLTFYDSASNVTATVQYVGSPLARTTRTEYDVLNRPMMVTQNYAPGQTGADKNLVTVTGYDANGNVVTTTALYGTPLSRTTVTGYDALNHPVTVTQNYTGNGTFDPALPDWNLTTLTAYNAAGQVVSATTAYGSALAQTTLTEYDRQGRPVTVTQNYAASGIATPDRNLMQVTVYGPSGERAATLEQRVQPGGQTVWLTTTFGYNNLGQLITTTQPLTVGEVAVTTQQYDALGRVVATTDALGMVTRMEYDALGRAVTVTTNYTTAALANPYNLTTLTAYNAAGQRVRITDANTHTTQFGYDAVGRLSLVIDALSGTTRYTYNVAGNLTVITDARTHPTTFTYDLLGRQLTERDALGHTWYSEYDAAGNRTVLTDALQQVTHFIYDTHHRLQFADYPGATPDVVFEYDLLDRRTVMTDGTGTTMWQYDALGRPRTVTHSETGPVGYAYDSAGNRTQLVYPNGKVVDYAYDGANRLRQVSDLATVTHYAYNALGQPLTTTLPNGVTTLSGYDAAHRLTTLTHRTVTRTLASYAYILDSVGNRTAVLENLLTPALPVSYTPPTNPQYLPLVFRLTGPPTIQYTYDELNRLTTARYTTGPVFTYTYDAVGNRLTQQTLTATTSYLYDEANRLTSVGGQTYSWDDNGNLLSDGATTYNYDAANHLLTATTPALTTHYAYNGLGDRVQQTENGTPTTYTVDMAGGLTQVLADGTLWLRPS